MCRECDRAVQTTHGMPIVPLRLRRREQQREEQYVFAGMSRARTPSKPSLSLFSTSTSSLSSRADSPPPLYRTRDPMTWASNIPMSVYLEERRKVYAEYERRERQKEADGNMNYEFQEFLRKEKRRVRVKKVKDWLKMLGRKCRNLCNLGNVECIEGRPVGDLRS